MVKTEGKEHRREKGLQGRRRIFKVIWFSQQGIVQLRERGEDIDIVLELTTRDKQVQEQEQINKIRNTKYGRICKFIEKIGLPGYLEGKQEGKVRN